MNLIKHIATAFYKSLYDFKWIALQRQSFIRAFAFFFVFFFAVVGVRGWFFMEDAPAAISGHWETVQAELPEFSIEKTDDGLSFVGLDQPFVKEFEEDGEQVTVYIDTVSTSSVSIEDVLGEDADRYGVIVTSKKLKFFDPTTGRTEVENISQLPNFSFTKAQVGEEIAKWTDKLFPGLFVAGVFFFTIFLGVGKLIYLLILSWLAYVVARSDKKQWTFGQIYTIGLYAIAPAILFQFVVTFFNTQIPYVYSLLALGMMYMVVYKGIEEKQQPPKK